MLDSDGSFWNGSPTTQSWGRFTGVQSLSSKARLLADRKSPVFWNPPDLPLPKPKSFAASLA